jgi:DNA-binding response OmpR family regulator
MVKTMVDRRRALVIEDDADLRDFVEQLLNERGYDVHVCADGVQAWTQIRTVRPHLLILDLQLPGVGGLELLVRVRGHPDTASMSVLICSGASDVVRALTDSFRRFRCDVIEKPFKIDDFVRSIDRLSGERPPD